MVEKKVLGAPDFDDGDIEFRCEGDEVFVYATDAGLEKLMSYCHKLLEKKGEEHLHLDDYEVLTRQSLKGVLAKFKKSKKKSKKESKKGVQKRKKGV